MPDTLLQATNNTTAATADSKARNTVTAAAPPGTGGRCHCPHTKRPVARGGGQGRSEQLDLGVHLCNGDAGTSTPANEQPRAVALDKTSSGFRGHERTDREPCIRAAHAAAVETGRRDTDNRRRRSVDGDAAANRRRLPVEEACPETIADHDDGRGSAPFTVGAIQQPPGGRNHAQCREVIGADDGGEQLVGRAVGAPQDHRLRKQVRRVHVTERTASITEGHVVGVGQRIETVPIPGATDVNELFRAPHAGLRPEQQPACHGVQRGVGAYADGE
jgi:hypothetical protein